MRTLDGLLHRLMEIASELPEEERPSFKPGASSEAIAKLQLAVGAPLRAEFRAFLLRHDAIVAMQVHNGYWIGGATNLTHGIDHQFFPTSVDDGPSQQKVMPIATDGGGNCYLQSLTDGRVWRHDHETGACRHVANTFAHFLERVAEDWEAFLRGNDGWNYLT